MSKKNITRIYAVLGIVSAVFAVLMVVLPFTKGIVFWLSLVFGLLAVGVQFYVQPKAFAGEELVSKVYGFPVARIGFLYLAVQLGLSLLLTAVGKWVPWWVALVLYVVALGAAAVGFIAADAMREEVERQEVQLKKDVGCMRTLQAKSRFLISQCGSDRLRPLLEQLGDELRYSDPVSGDALAAIEAKLTGEMARLEQAMLAGNEESAAALCRQASVTLNERNTLCKLSKK